MADASTSPYPQDYPTVDPSSFDLVVCGTGLPESVLAAASAAAGKAVLHVDPNPFYGSLFSSLPLSSFPAFLSSSSSSSNPSPSTAPSSHAVVGLQRHSLYSEIETSGPIPEPSRAFTVDLVGPRVLYCADEAVDLLLRSGGSHHVEFKSVEGGCLLYWEGGLYPVPDSRQSIFKDATLQLKEKNLLFRFFKRVQSHIASPSSGNEAVESDTSAKISEEDLDLPFIEFLKKQQLSPKMRAVVLYAIAKADYDQESADTCKTLLTTREGIETIALYSSSIGRFANAAGAFIYPMYGHGELPQAFCRCAAVKGALYVLRMPVAALLMDEEKRRYIGTRLASGQDIFCQQLIMDPSYKIPTFDACPDGSNSNLSRMVARGVCIISSSVKLDSSNVLVVFPPKSLGDQQVTAIWVLQLSSNVAVCPPGRFMVYLSTPCVDAITGKQCINKAIDILFRTETSDGSEGTLETTSENEKVEVKPTLIWSCVYVQEITQSTSDSALSCPMPDEKLDYRCTLESTRKLFTDIYPNEEFLSRTSAPEYDNDDVASE